MVNVTSSESYPQPLPQAPGFTEAVKRRPGLGAAVNAGGLDSRGVHGEVMVKDGKSWLMMVTDG